MLSNRFWVNGISYWVNFEEITKVEQHSPILIRSAQHTKPSKVGRLCKYISSEKRRSEALDLGLHKPIAQGFVWPCMPLSHLQCNKFRTSLLARSTRAVWLVLGDKGKGGRKGGNKMRLLCRARAHPFGRSEVTISGIKWKGESLYRSRQHHSS